MSKTSKSQWDFGELFAPEQTRRVLSVAELTTQVKRLLEKQIGSLWVSGEISNFRLQGSSGHIYFTLKDAAAQLSCVLFRQEAVPHRGLLQDGQKVLLQGDLTVYEARGQYQMLVRAVELQGVGALQLQFEQLKQKLAAAGWFAPARKRPVPQYAQRIGLVTSPTGAAIRDVLHVIQRRNPGLEIIFVPCRVQGEGAAREIAQAIGSLNDWHQSETQNARAAMDLILVTRGGGSLEDLWAFNEEAVARAIFESALPVVSAVGHEIDFTIADFVADLRAATPSAAAELITEGVFASRTFVAAAPLRLHQLARQAWGQAQERIADLVLRLGRQHPHRWCAEQTQRLDDLMMALQRCGRHGLRERQVAACHLAERLKLVRPRQAVQLQAEQVRLRRRRLIELGRLQFQRAQERLATLTARLRLLGPEQVLARGYSITMDATTGAVVREARKLKSGQKLRTRLKVGTVDSTVES